MNKIIINQESEIPLIGCIAFGVLDKGTNLIQIRPTSACNLKCIFCSTSANEPKIHPITYEIELNYLLQYIKEIIKFKESNITILIDSVGESLCYKNTIKLIDELRKFKQINEIALETNGTLLNTKNIKQLKQAGLDRINLSIHSLNPELAKKLSGTENYNLNKILENIKVIKKENIDLLLTPVYLPNINYDEIIKLIKFAKQNNIKIVIQKYEIFRHGRKIKKSNISWYKFYEQLKKWQKEFNIKLLYTPKDFGIIKTKKLPIKFKKNEKVLVKIKASGWLTNQKLGVAKNRCISVNNCNAKINDNIKVKILDNKNNIYLAN